MTLCCRRFLQQTPQFPSTDSKSCRKIERAVYPSVWPRLSSLRPLHWCLMFILYVCFLAERSEMVGCRQYSRRRGEKLTTAADGAGKWGKYFFLLINRQELLLLNGVWQDDGWRITLIRRWRRSNMSSYMFLQMLVLYDWARFCLHDDTPSSLRHLSLWWLRNNLQLLYQEFHTVSKWILEEV